jgi:hypothetical protein
VPPPSPHTHAAGNNAGRVVKDHNDAGHHDYSNSDGHGMHDGEFADDAEDVAAAILDGTPRSPNIQDGVHVHADGSDPGRRAASRCAWMMSSRRSRPCESRIDAGTERSSKDGVAIERRSRGIRVAHVRQERFGGAD